MPTGSKGRTFPRLSWVGGRAHLQPDAKVVGGSVLFNAHVTREEACHTGSSDQDQLHGILGVCGHREGMLPLDHWFESKGAPLLGCLGQGLQGSPGP